MTFHGLDLLGSDALDDVRGGSVLKRGSKGDAVKAGDVLVILPLLAGGSD